MSGQCRTLQSKAALFAVAHFALAGAFAASDVCTWTGAEDAFWTNANNWAELRVPGRYETAAGLAGEVGDVAVFGDALEGRRVTTVDFDGVHSVREVLTSGTNRYVYGTSEGQLVPIEPFGTFSAAETATTPAATLVAGLKLGVDCMSTNWGGEAMTVRSNSRETFVLGKWGYGNDSPDRPAGAVGGQARVNFDGTGDIRIVEPYQFAAWHMMVYLRMTGRLVVDAPLKVRMLSADNGVSGETMEVELTENGSIEPDSCYNYFAGYRSMHVSGPGTFYFGVGSRNGVGVICEFQHGGTLVLDCPVATRIVGDPPPDGYRARLFASWSGGSFEMRGGSALKGDALMLTYGALIAERIGMRGTYGSLGDLDFLLGGGGAVRYVGGGETTDRSILLTNNVPATSVEGCLDHQGSGAWTVKSAVALAPNLERGTLTLKGAAAAPATFAGSLAPNVAIGKQGDGDWTFAPADAFTGDAYVSGGTLRLGGSMHLSSLTASGGSTRVIVPDGATLEIDALTAEEGKVDFCALSDAAVVKIAGVEAGDAPAGVSCNGHPAAVDADGRLSVAEGAAAIWKAAESGDWTDAARWTWGLTPAAAGTAFVDAPGGDYAVSVAEDAVVSNLVVRNLGGGTATLRVSGGATLDVAGRTASGPVLTVGAGGRIDVVDAKLRISDRGSDVGGMSNVSGLCMEEGGEIAVRGAGTLTTFGIPASGYVAGELNSNLNTQFKFEAGETTFEDDATLALEQETSRTVFYHTIKAAKGRTTRMSFRGRAHPDFTYVPWTLYVTGGGGRAVLEFDSECGKTVKNLWNQTFVGNHEGGVGEIVYRRGSYETGGWDMYHVASPNTDVTSGSTTFATGRVEVASAASLTVYAGMPLDSYGGFGGFTVGNGIALQKRRGLSFLRGEFAVAGGFTQHMGNFLVGMGPCAEGDVRIDGGDARVVADASKTNAATFGEAVLGAFGGRARLALDGGSFSTLRNVYVGGVLTNDLRRAHRNGDFITQWHDAEGTLSVKGGTFTTAGSIVLGRDGTGTLELSGTGVVSAASVVVSNTIGQAASRILFTADADGRCGQIAPETALSFESGAAVTVDVSACAATRSRIVVWNLNEPPAGLGRVYLELVGNEAVRGPNALSLEEDGRRLVWNACRGTVILLR